VLETQLLGDDRAAICHAMVVVAAWLPLVADAWGVSVVGAGERGGGTCIPSLPRM